MAASLHDMLDQGPTPAHTRQSSVPLIGIIEQEVGPLPTPDAALGQREAEYGNARTQHWVAGDTRPLLQP